jgi:hypothetical protein
MPVKKIEGLPNIEEIKGEIAVEEEQIERKERSLKKKKTVRWVLLSLFLVAVILTGINFLANYEAPIQSGTGGVSGQVVNISLTPVPAEVFIVGSNLSAQADDQGQFSMINIPAGEITVIVAYQGQGVEIPVVVTSNETSKLGQIKVESTQIPIEP